MLSMEVRTRNVNCRDADDRYSLRRVGGRGGKLEEREEEDGEGRKEPESTNFVRKKWLTVLIKILIRPILTFL